MKKRIKFFTLLILVWGLIILAVFIIDVILKEKYCYNFAFTALDRKGIKLGEVEQELKEKGYSPLQSGLTPGHREWYEFYLKCRNGFNLTNINFSVLIKSYPNYEHFIDW